MLLATKQDVTDIVGRLRQALTDFNVDLRHVVALNAVAAALGFRDTNAMTAALRDGPLTLAMDESVRVAVNDAIANRIVFDQSAVAARFIAYLAAHRSVNQWKPMAGFVGRI